MRIFLFFIAAFLTYFPHSYAENMFSNPEYDLGNAMNGKGQNIEVLSKGGYGIAEVSTVHFPIAPENAAVNNSSGGGSGGGSSGSGSANTGTIPNIVTNQETPISSASPKNEEVKVTAVTENAHSTNTPQTNDSSNQIVPKKESVEPIIQEKITPKNTNETPVQNQDTKMIKNTENKVQNTQNTNTKNEQKRVKIVPKKAKNIDKNIVIQYSTIEQKKYTEIGGILHQEKENFHKSAFFIPAQSPLAYYGIIISIFGFLFIFFNFHHHAKYSNAFSLRKITR